MTSEGFRAKEGTSCGRSGPAAAERSEEQLGQLTAL